MPDAVISEALNIGARDALAGTGCGSGTSSTFPGTTRSEDARAALRFALDNPPDGLVGFGIGGDEAGRAPYTDVIRDVFEAAHARRAALRAARRGDDRAGDRVGGGQVPARGADRARDQVA